MADYTYETKCRRCGNFTEWGFGGGLNLSWSQFMIAVVDFIREPRLYSCSRCLKHTVQDVVAYTPSPLNRGGEHG